MKIIIDNNWENNLSILDWYYRYSILKSRMSILLSKVSWTGISLHRRTRCRKSLAGIEKMDICRNRTSLIKLTRKSKREDKGDIICEILLNRYIYFFLINILYIYMNWPQ